MTDGLGAAVELFNNAVAPLLRPPHGAAATQWSHSMSSNCTFNMFRQGTSYTHKTSGSDIPQCPNYPLATMTSQQAVVDDAVSALLAVEYKAFATLAFLVYDWLISLDEEIRWFWDFRKGRRLTAAALLYGITRYCAIIGQVLVVLTVFRMSETVCQVNGRLQTVTTISYVLAPPIFSTIRVYALSPNNKAIAILTFLLLCVPPFTTSVVNATDKATIQPSPFNCSSSPSLLALQLSHGECSR
ncbi:hypothetical protein LXA43DRAFT_647292 [Ganoderma leucocontextum]|nr:hypothetical protein LXA43DRAFT_647292 [Ganoderma leucocontextum]